MRVEFVVCEESSIAGKNCGWIRENIEDIAIIHIHHGIGSELERYNPPNEMIINSGDYIKVQGSSNSTLKLIELSLPYNKK